MDFVLIAFGIALVAGVFFGWALGRERRIERKRSTPSHPSNRRRR